MLFNVNSSKAGGIVGVAGWCYRVFSNKKIKLIFTAHGWAINEDRPKYQIKFKVANPEKTDGIITINIDLYDPNDQNNDADEPPDFSKKIFLAAGSAKE